tara:strand:- start:695 stop:1036 length:342 start_codon:yes stop_codon:yes gene_type:complete
MGFFSRLAHKVGGAVKSAVRFGVKNSEKISSIASKVGDVAGKIGDVATAGATITAGMGLEPVAGFLGGVAGASKLVGAGAKGVKGVADSVSKAKEVAGKFGIDANQVADRFLG